MGDPKNPKELQFEQGTQPDYLAGESYFVKEELKDSLKKEKLDGLIQDREERKRYANLSFTLIATWLILVLAIFVSTGQGNLKYSDSVLITLLTTTTANVIAIFHFVMKYLFQTK